MDAMEIWQTDVDVLEEIKPDARREVSRRLLIRVHQPGGVALNDPFSIEQEMNAATNHPSD